MYIQGGPKNWHIFFHALTSYALIKYCPIFKLISLTESRERL